MSRNLCRTDCSFCSGRVVLVGATRPILRSDTGIYFDEYEGMVVADAECIDCAGKYLAWVDDRARVKNRRWSSERNEDTPPPFFDLSFRASFNDEPASEDLPLYEIEILRCRKRIDWDAPAWKYWRAYRGEQ